MENDRVADWSKGLCGPPTMPSVHARPSPLVFQLTPHSALCLYVPKSHCMSGVHLFCIKVNGKDTMGVSHLACSSLKGYREKRAQGGRDIADNCIFY